MSNRAWMPLHLDDYLADTGHLSTIEHGAYFLLIMHYWRNGGLPSDERMISRIARLTADQWAESRDMLAALFRDGWRHKRIDEELAKADEIIEKRRAAANGRHSKSKTYANAMHMDSKCSDTGALPLTKNQDTDANASGAVAPIDPRGELWSEGIASIKAISGMTDSAARSMVGKWLKATSDDCSLVLSKIRTAQSERIGQPVPWITAALKSTGPPQKGASAAYRHILESEKNGPESPFSYNRDAKRLPPAGGGGSRNASADIPGGIGRQFITIDH